MTVAVVDAVAIAAGATGGGRGSSQNNVCERITLMKTSIQCSPSFNVCDRLYTEQWWYISVVNEMVDKVDEFLLFQFNNFLVYAISKVRVPFLDI